MDFSRHHAELLSLMDQLRSTVVICEAPKDICDKDHESKRGRMNKMKNYSISKLKAVHFSHYTKKSLLTQLQCIFRSWPLFPLPAKAMMARDCCPSFLTGFF